MGRGRPMRSEPRKELGGGAVIRETEPPARHDFDQSALQGDIENAVAGLSVQGGGGTEFNQVEGGAPEGYSLQGENQFRRHSRLGGGQRPARYRDREGQTLRSR